MSSIIFFGAGGNAINNFEKWIDQGIIPVCFCDSDKSKHYTKFITKGGGYDILPLNEAIRLYPDYIIYPTQNPSHLKSIIIYLLNIGIHENRIKIFPRYCNNIINNMNIFSFEKYLTNYTFCFNQQIRPLYKSSGNLKDDYDMIQKYGERMINDLKLGKICSCSYCSNLKEGNISNFSTKFFFNIGSGIKGSEYCNMKCIYCSFLNINNKNDIFNYSLMDIFNFLSFNFNSDDLFITYGCGEITVSPYYKYIMNIWEKKNWCGRLITNALIFKDEISKLLKQKRISLNVSLDAGTEDTYFKIKGVNYFSKNIKTLKKYSEMDGNIELKYILLNNLNDNETDIFEFLNIAKQLNSSSVIISRPFNKYFIPLSNHEKSLIKYFISISKDFNLKIENYLCYYINNINDINFVEALL
ncbi:MAG: radical SAM protein [Treponema sp.]|nr:radical SAM protein [Treponema sp.]